MLMVTFVYCSGVFSGEAVLQWWCSSGVEPCGVACGHGDSSGVVLSV